MYAVCMGDKPYTGHCNVERYASYGESVYGSLSRCYVSCRDEYTGAEYHSDHDSARQVTNKLDLRCVDNHVGEVRR